jgi:hypothetical protein
MAVLFRKGSPIGRYVVQDLSPRGAILTGGSEVARGKPVRVVLDLPDGELGIVARVHRVAAGPQGLYAVDVRFPSMKPSDQDRIHDLVLQALETAPRGG